VHCRACPVYTRNGLQLLNRSISPDYRREWTERFARQKELVSHTNASAVIFRIDSDWLALPTQIFQEIAECRPIHSIPHSRAGILLGLANVRGELLLCVDLGRLLALTPTPGAPSLRVRHRRLLVINPGGERFALPVDEVHGTCRFNLQDLQTPPATLARAQRSYTAGFLANNGRSAAFLKPDLVLSDIRRFVNGR
jgi:chemotaxis-related protein WspD